MKWAYNIQQKFRAAVLLAIVFFLVFAKNLIDKNNLSELQSSFSSVYEDRLLVENYIFQISGHLYQQEILVDRFDGHNTDQLQPALGEHRTAIDALLTDYEATRFTEAETAHFNDLKQHLRQIQSLEARYLSASGPVDRTTYEQLETEFHLASEKLEQLSSIQIAEGKQLTDHSQRIMASSSLLSQFELILLIVVGLLIQGLVLASRSVRPKFPQQPGMN